MPFGRAPADAPLGDVGSASRVRTDPMLFRSSAAGGRPLARDTLRDAAPPVQVPGVPGGVDLPLSSDRTPPMGGPVVELAPEPLAVTPFGPPVRLTPRGLGPVDALAATRPAEVPASASAEVAEGSATLARGQGGEVPASPQAELLARALDEGSAERKKKDFLSSSGENARLKAAVVALDAAASVGAGSAVASATKQKKIPDSDRKEFATAAQAPRPVPEAAELEGPKVDVSRADPRQAATQRALRTVEGPRGKKKAAHAGEVLDVGAPTLPHGHDAASSGRVARVVVVGAVVALALAGAWLLWIRRGPPSPSADPPRAAPSATAPPNSGEASTGRAVEGASPTVAASPTGDVSANAAPEPSSAPTAAVASSSAPALPAATSASKAAAQKAPAASAPVEASPTSEFYGDKTPSSTKPKKPTKDEFYP